MAMATVMMARTVVIILLLTEVMEMSMIIVYLGCCTARPGLHSGQPHSPRGLPYRYAIRSSHSLLL